jgi:hypothetical protein
MSHNIPRKGGWTELHFFFDFVFLLYEFSKEIPYYFAV